VSTRIDPDLRREVARFGAEDVEQCINCGNCTAVCSLSEGDTLFPRRTIRYLQLGLKDKLLGSVEPWLCYYCGECSETCPRQANPGETMMAMRRYLTSEYDPTRLSKRLYLSKTWEIAMLVGVGVLVLALFYFFHGPIITDHVALNTFAPAEWVEVGDWTLAAILSVLLLSNVYRMHRHLMAGEGSLKIPLSLYFKEFWTLIVHGLTQKRWRDCEGPTRWLKHLLLVAAYLTMLVLVVFFLRWFQTDELRPLWHPARLLGYFATVVLLYVVGDAIISRLRKREEIHRHSHVTDWMFLILLFATALTGIAVHVFRRAGLPLWTYYTYAIHLAIAVSMLAVEVPFGKWAHLAYRPIAIYLTNVKHKAKELVATAGGPATESV
jgi:ferredoxin